MKARIFAELPVIINMERVKLSVGQKFLTGNAVMAQQESKKIGDMITYYLVTDADENGMNISFKPIYEKMEE